MSSIPLPALDLKPPQTPDVAGQFGNLLRLKALQQQSQQQAAEAPLRQQILQNQAQSTALATQQQQQTMKDQQAMTAAMQQWDGKDLNGLVPLVVKNGASANAVIGLKQKVLAQKQQAASIAASDATTGSKNIATMMQKNDMISGALSTVLQTPDAQLPQAVVATAQDLAQKGLLDPQHVQMAEKIAQSGNPAQIRTQLDAMRKGMMANSQILDDAQKQAQTDAARSTAAKNNLEIQNGGPLTDEGRFISNYLKSKGLSNTPANQLAAQQEYNRETRIQPAIERENAYASTREYPVIDTANGNRLVYASAADINSANTTTPGRFAPAAQGDKALGKTALIEDIRGNVASVRQSLQNPKMPEFTAGQRSAIALALGGPDPGGALTAAFRGGVLGSLTPEQQDYLINMAQLEENAMAMRSVLGAGQGSEDLRNAIRATLPGPRTPSKLYASKQLDAFEKVLNRLEKGIPNVPLAGTGTAATPLANPAATSSGSGGDFFSKFGGKGH